MGKRSYVPAIGDSSPDPVMGGSANAYDYANQDPVNNFDLTGEKCTKAQGKNNPQLCGRCQRGEKLCHKIKHTVNKTRRIEREHGLHIRFHTGTVHVGGPSVGSVLKDVAKVVYKAAKSQTVIDDAVEGYINKVKGLSGGVKEKAWGCAEEASAGYQEASALVAAEGPEAAAAGYGWIIAKCGLGFLEG